MDEKDLIIPKVSADILDFERFLSIQDKSLKCTHERIEVDSRNREVTCKDCGKLVDPFDSLVAFARKGSDVKRSYTALQDEVQRLKEWKPFLTAMKTLEKIWRGKMLPMCPHCGVGIAAEKLANSGCVHRAFGERRRTEMEVALETENEQLREALGRVNGQQDEKDDRNNE
jgi:DNA-directed RNA polymerase subunit RPC12/RpoP